MSGPRVCAVRAVHDHQEDLPDSALAIRFRVTRPGAKSGNETGFIAAGTVDSAPVYSGKCRVLDIDSTSRRARFPGNIAPLVVDESTRSRQL